MKIFSLFLARFRIFDIPLRKICLRMKNIDAYVPEHVFRYEFPSDIGRIETPLRVLNLSPQRELTVNAVWDTGATYSSGTEAGTAGRRQGSEHRRGRSCRWQHIHLFRLPRQQKVCCAGGSIVAA